MGEDFLSNRRPPGIEPGSSRTRPRRAPPRPARRDIGTTPLFDEFTQIDSHRLRYIEEIDLLRVIELRERLAVHIRRIVLMRINLKVARQLLLLLLARQPGLWDDALARRDRQRVAEEDGGIRQGLARESRQGGLPVPDRVLGHVDDLG